MVSAFVISFLLVLSEGNKLITAPFLIFDKAANVKMPRVRTQTFCPLMNTDFISQFW